MSAPRILIAAPPQFDFLATVHSHGWCALPPFSWDAAAETLEYILHTAPCEPQRLWIRAAEAGVQVELPDCDEFSPELKRQVQAAVARMLNLDWDLSAFYAAMRAHEGYGWLEREGRGRILVCPSLWEDLAKVLLTTNCSWSQTVNMTSQLCQLGARHPTIADCFAFPSAKRIADMDFDELAASVRAGYRTAWLHELARQIADGELDLDAWHSLDSDGLFKQVKALMGFGDYAAGTIARMMGHFDRLAIDTAAHAMFAARHNDGLKAEAEAIAEHYERYGEWRGLLLWMDIMRNYED